MTAGIILGYEVGTGQPVTLQPQHLAVTGQTQQSGKTTTLEALVARSGATALTFITKRGEASFADGRRITPYFRDRADWQFVTSILDAQLQEKNKFLRPWIIKICSDTRTLAEVQRKVKAALLTARGINEGVYTQLDAYLDLIVPEIARARLAATLDLQPGVNVMDVSSFATPMQMLFVQSALDWVNEHCRNTVVVIPEAWEFIPEGKGSPVKASAITLVRKGAGIGNYIWVDSQDMAGVDKTILRGCTTWLIGVQREANEIKRSLSNIPKGTAQPKAADVALLERGQFYACWGRHCVKTYVWPVWMASQAAQEFAVGHTAAPPTRPAPAPKPKEATVNEREAAQLREDNELLRQQVASLQQRLNELVDAQRGPMPRVSRMRGHSATEAEADEIPGVKTREPQPFADQVPFVPGPNFDAVYAEIKRRAVQDPGVLEVLASRPEIRVTIDRPVIQAGGNSLLGRVALLVVDGFFDQGATASAAFTEMQKRGWSHDKRSVYRTCDDLTEQGFLRKETGGYQSVPDTKVDIKKTRA